MTRIKNIFPETFEASCVYVTRFLANGSGIFKFREFFWTANHILLISFSSSCWLEWWLEGWNRISFFGLYGQFQVIWSISVDMVTWQLDLRSARKKKTHSKEHTSTGTIISSISHERKTNFYIGYSIIWGFRSLATRLNSN